jgi:butyryl-CoA dehydrogenase
MFDLTDDQKSVRERTRAFAEREVAPRAAAMDAVGSLEPEVLEALFSAGLMGMLVPEEYGGRGAGALEYVTAVEELARADASTALVMSIHSSLVVALLTEEDPSAPTRACEEEGSLVVNGTKTYITNGPIADVVILFAVTGRTESEKGGKTVARDEVSALLIETDGADSLARSSVGAKLGLSAAPVGRLEFRGVRVPSDRLVGGRGAGFRMAMRALDGGRIAAAAMAVGVGQAALDAARDYARSRVTQGRPIAKFQAVQFMIAEAATRLAAARALTYQAAAAADRGEPITGVAAQAKLFATETASFVASRALQVHGGSGVMRDLHHVERYFRDARVLEIIEGTSEIQKLVVAGWELK